MRNGRTCANHRPLSPQLIEQQQQQQRSTFSPVFENHRFPTPLGVNFSQHGTQSEATTEATKSIVDREGLRILTYWNRVIWWLMWVQLKKPFVRMWKGNSKTAPWELNWWIGVIISFIKTIGCDFTQDRPRAPLFHKIILFAQETWVYPLKNELNLGQKELKGVTNGSI